MLMAILYPALAVAASLRGRQRRCSARRGRRRDSSALEIAADEPQQLLGDAWRNHREVGGMRFRDADEAVHDAPDGAEQADEGGGRTDGGKHTGAAQDP